MGAKAIFDNVTVKFYLQENSQNTTENWQKIMFEFFPDQMLVLPKGKRHYINYSLLK